MRIFSDKTMQTLEKALDAASLRQSVLSHNIANVNTPGYKRSFVTFEETLQQALGKKNKMALAGFLPGHLKTTNRLEKVKPQVEKDKSTSHRQDGNNVDVDVEMAQLAMNTINYYTAISRVNGKLGVLRYVISEGRR